MSLMWLLGGEELPRPDEIPQAGRWRLAYDSSFGAFLRKIIPNRSSKEPTRAKMPGSGVATNLPAALANSNVGRFCEVNTIHVLS
jgi:hypothetical protein